MDVVILPTKEDVGKYVASDIADLLRRKPNAVLGFATGTTPIPVYQELVKLHKEGLDFSRATAFNLDEYFGIGYDPEKNAEEDQSYARFMKEQLFDHINLPEERRFIPGGYIPVFQVENHCNWYEEQIRKADGIDYQILGIGGNGHWAFNEPGSSLGSRTRLIILSQQTLDDNWGSFYKNVGVSKEDMPKAALTMGIGTILEYAKKAVMLAIGRKKAEVVAQAIEGPITNRITASAIQLHRNPKVVLDEAAASALKYKNEYIHNHNQALNMELEKRLK